MERVLKNYQCIDAAQDNLTSEMPKLSCLKH